MRKFDRMVERLWERHTLPRETIRELAATGMCEEACEVLINAVESRNVSWDKALYFAQLIVKEMEGAKHSIPALF